MKFSDAIYKSATICVVIALLLLACAAVGTGRTDSRSFQDQVTAGFPIIASMAGIVLGIAAVIWGVGRIGGK